jgi:hypothetical protein
MPDTKIAERVEARAGAAPEQTQIKDDMNPNEVLVLEDLMYGAELRCSVEPPANDFTKAGAVPVDETLSYLTKWHAQGLMFRNLNDDFATDGVEHRWRLNINGLELCRTIGLYPPPAITALNPATAPAGADVTVQITGTDFRAPTVNIGVAYGLTPTSVTATDLSVVVEAINIAKPGTLPMSVTNRDGQVSNEMDFVIT